MNEQFKFGHVGLLVVSLQQNECVFKDSSKLRRYSDNNFQKGRNEIQSKAIFQSFDYVSLVDDEFALKAIAEREDDNIY